MAKSLQLFPWRWLVAGVAAGVLFVVAILVLNELCPSGENMASALLLLPILLMLRPAQFIFQLCGWQWDWISRGPWGHFPLFPVFMVLMTNVVLFATISVSIGFMLRIVRRIMIPSDALSR